MFEYKQKNPDFILPFLKTKQAHISFQIILDISGCPWPFPPKKNWLMCGYLWIYLWIPKHIPYHIYLKFILQICVYYRSLELIGPNTLYLKVLHSMKFCIKCLHSDNCYVISDQKKISDLEFTIIKKPLDVSICTIFKNIK